MRFIPSKIHAFIDYTVSTTNVTCAGNNNGSATITTIGGGPYTYSWPNGGMQNSKTGLSAGEYNVTVSDAGCNAIVSIMITEPPLLTINPTLENPLCNGSNDGSIKLNVKGGVPQYSFIWNSSSTDSTQNNLVAGNYLVTVSDVNGCSLTQSMNLTEPDSLSHVITKSNTLCYNDSTGAVSIVVSGGTSPYAYLWSNSGTDSLLSAVTAGIYNVTVTDAHNCNFTASAEVSQAAQIMVSITATASDGNNGVAVASASGGTPPYSYAWNTNPPQQNDTATGLAPGTYTVLVKDSNNCTLTESVIVESVNGISAIEGRRMNIFPVPFKEELNLEMNLEKEGSVQVSILDLTGKVVYQNTLHGKNIKTGLKIRELANGMYFMKVDTEKEHFIRKITKE